MKEVKLYLFGDSICFGQLVSHHLTWISSLSRRLDELSQGRFSFLIQNASINGNTTRQALERISYDVTSHQPDLVLVQFGMNDCNYWQTDFCVPRVSQRSFEANLIEIAERVLLTGSRHVFLCTNHPSLKGNFSHFPSESHSNSNKKYNEIIRNAFEFINCEKQPVTLIDNEKYWLQTLSNKLEMKLESLLLPDGIHLSIKGHELYDSFVGQIILDKVKECFL